MNRNRILGMFTALIIGALYLGACQNNVNTTLEDSIAPYMELQSIEEASNTTVTVNRGETKGLDSYFALDLSNLKSNVLVREGLTEGWCLEWDKPLRQNNDVHTGVELYNTRGNKTWKPANYLMNIKNELQSNDPELTYREIQVALWSLIETPKFDLDKVLRDGDMPSRLMNNGEPNFSVEKVKEIVNRVRDEVSDYDPEDGGPVIAYMRNDDDQQVTGISVDGTMFAMGDGAEGSFRCNDNIDLRRWGWVFEYDLVGGQKTHDFMSGSDVSNGNGRGNGNGNGNNGSNTECDPYVPNSDKVGELIVSYEEPILSLKYTNAGLEYFYKDPHIWIGCERTDINDITGQGFSDFPYPVGFDKNEIFNEKTFEIDITKYNCGGDKIYISAHAGN